MVNITPNTSSGPVSPADGRSFTFCRIAQSETNTTPASIRQNALQSGGTVSTPTRIDTTFPPHKIETSKARHVLERPIGCGVEEDTEARVNGHSIEFALPQEVAGFAPYTENAC